MANAIVMFYVSSVKSAFFLAFLFHYNSAQGGRRRRRREPQTSCEEEEGTERLRRWTQKPTVSFLPRCRGGGRAVSAAAPPSLWAEQHAFPPKKKTPGSLQSPRLPHPSATPITGPQSPNSHPVSSLVSPSRLLSELSDESLPWRFCAFRCFPSSIPSFHAFFFSSSLKLSKCLSAYKRPRLFHRCSCSPPSPLSVFSLNICRHRSTSLSPLRAKGSRERLRCCRLQSFIPFLQHIIGATSQKFHFILVF